MTYAEYMQAQAEKKQELVRRTRWLAQVITGYADEEGLKPEDLIREIAKRASDCADTIEEQEHQLTRAREGITRLQDEIDGMRAAFNV